MSNLTRRVTVMGAGFGALSLLMGCADDKAPGSSAGASTDSQGSERMESPGAASLAWNALLLVEAGAEGATYQEPLAQMERYYTQKTSNLVAWNDGALVGAGSLLLHFDRAAGEVLARYELISGNDDDAADDIMSIAVADDVAYAATSAGYFISIDLAVEEFRWSTLACPVSPEGSTGNLPGAWVCTDIALTNDAAVVGYSSYQLGDVSTVVCVDASTGAVRWTRQLEGRLDTAGGIGYPVAADAGLLLPMPDGSGLGLLSMQTGETLDLLETDSPIYMGLTMSDGGGLPCYFQSKLGTLYKVDVENGALVAASAEDACTDSAKRIPSGARPLLADGHVIVNAATQDEDAKRFDGDYNPSAGECVVFDAETLEVLERRDAPEIESTPVLVGTSMYYLGRAGIYGAVLEGGIPGDPELVFDTEGRDRDVWEQQLLAADGMLYFVGGPHGERWLYAIGPADDA